MKKKNANETVDDRVSVFTDFIQEGPFYICIVCNRCLYKRSVKIYKIDKYPETVRICKTNITII